VYTLAHRGLRVFVQVWDSEEHVTLAYKHVLCYKNYTKPRTAANVARINGMRNVCWKYLTEENTW